MSSAAAEDSPLHAEDNSGGTPPPVSFLPNGRFKIADYPFTPRLSKVLLQTTWSLGPFQHCNEIAQLSAVGHFLFYKLNRIEELYPIRVSGFSAMRQVFQGIAVVLG